MAGFMLRLLIVALGLWLGSELVPGIEGRGVGTLLGGGYCLVLSMLWCGRCSNPTRRQTLPSSVIVRLAL